MLRVKTIFALCATVFIFSNCNPLYRAASVQYKEYRVMNLRTDSSLQSFLQPYRDSMSSNMNVVIAALETDLEKGQPECTLGNFMADAMMVMAEKKIGVKPDISFVNYGGIRLPSVKAGVLTRGKLYELFPFDNLLVIVTIKGDVLQQFLDHISARGGWPVAGMRMQIRDKKAVNISINGAPLDPSKEYKIALGDYTANGGDDAAMLKGLPQLNKGYLMRDAFIDYAASLQTIKGVLQKRVSYVE
jgi:2',3'-cyclic-nucleotide 2'-phosphodiesterase (5'-nucleotidase family)